MKTKLFLTVALFLAFTAVSNAQQQGTAKEKQNVTSVGTAWVDANNDGVCDNFAERSTTRSGNGNGFLRGRGQGQGQGQSQGQFQGQGRGNGMGNGICGAGQGRNAGKNYVDANNNGICDLRESQPEK